jgi:MoaA/NifB/PqqE/SkfB family radical SAM enzyme
MKNHEPFTPREIIFAPTGLCNLACPHCRVDRARGRRSGEAPLSLEEALTFIDDCLSCGIEIERIGFSGGEPFLEPIFLQGIIAHTVERELLFDRLMTNGDWWEGNEQLENTLRDIYDSGFDGTLGISYDDWHEQDSRRMETFIRKVREVESSASIELFAVRNRDGSSPIKRYQDLASGLGADLEWYESENRGTIGGDWNISVTLSPCSDAGAASTDQGSTRSSASWSSAAWSDDDWFIDDWCEGPGNVFYVHPDGMVSVCCGFANEKKELIPGRVSDGAKALLERARSMPMVHACYVQGLGSIRVQMEKEGALPPGKTKDMCLFCHWLCDTTKNR